VEPNELPRDDVLILAPTGRDAATTSELLRRAGITSRICDIFDALLTGIGLGAGVAFVAEEGLFGQDLDTLAEQIRNQPAWSDIPFVMLTSRHDHPSVAAWRRTQIECLGNVSLIERPVQPITLVSVMQAALRARRRQFEIRALLQAREAAATQLESLVEMRTGQLQAANTQLREEMAERTRVEETLRHAQKLEALAVDRRRRARFQQPADGHHRRSGCAAAARRSGTARKADARDAAGGATRGESYPAVAGVLAHPRVASGNRQSVDADRQHVRAARPQPARRHQG
jgi:hypothetical protein